MEPAKEQSLSAALDALWTRFQPEMLERVSTLEEAAAAFMANQISPAQHEAAHADAHKLAGALGMFGLTQGTVLARELEQTFARENGPDPALCTRVVQMTAELRAMIESRS